MKTIFYKVKRSSLWIWGIILIVLFVALNIIIHLLLINKKKRIVIYPKFKIVDVKNEKDIDTNVVDSSVKIGRDILKKVGVK